MVTEETGHDAFITSSDSQQLLSPTDKPMHHKKSNLGADDVSLHSFPTIVSATSAHGITRGDDKVSCSGRTQLCLCACVISFSIKIIKYQKKRELMVLFPTKLSFCLQKKVVEVTL